MKRNLDLYYKDILGSIDTIKARVAGVSEEDFKRDGEKHESIVLRLAIIGEAVNKIPAEILDKYKQIDWKAIISMRNILIHEYYEVDLEIIWDTIINDLDILREIIVQMREE